jgi:hypothetical protein
MVFQFFSGHERHLWASKRKWNLLALILFAGVAVLALWKMRRHALAGGQLLIGILFVAACIGPLVFDLLQHTYTISVPRYAIAALPAAYLLAGTALASLGRRFRFVALALIVIAWIPNLLTLQRKRLPWMPVREIARFASANDSRSDLILVHSIPSGVLGIARYADGPAPLASWVGQLGNRRTPESLQKLAAGRTRIWFLKLHEVGEPAPEETWLRANAVVVEEKQFEMAKAIDFRPRNAETF